MEEPTDREYEPLRQKEINSLRSMVGVISKYAESLRDAHDTKNKEGFYVLAQEKGYKVSEVTIGSEHEDLAGEITEGNSVRIGKNKNLYVGINKDGTVYDFNDLGHDVGAILLGGKEVGPEETAYIRIKTFNEVSKKSMGKTLNDREINYTKPLNEGRIAVTYLFDSIVYDREVPFRAIKYA